MGASVEVDDVGEVAPGQCSVLVLARMCVAGNGRVRSFGFKPKGMPFHPEFTDEGKNGRARFSGSSEAFDHGLMGRGGVVCGSTEEVLQDHEVRAPIDLSSSVVIVAHPLMIEIRRHSYSPGRQCRTVRSDLHPDYMRIFRLPARPDQR